MRGKPKHCMAPFSSINLLPTGAQVCCYHAQPVHEIESLEQWWSSETMIELRRKLRNGIFEGHCKACTQAGLYGATNMYNLHPVDMTEDVPDINKVELVNLCISNKCNLACRTCNSQLSSTHGVLGARLGYLPKDAGKVKRLPLRIVEEVAALNPVKVLVAGGEPLADPHFHEAVKLFDPQVYLHLITNGTYHNPEFYKTILAHEHNRVTFSLDGGRKQNNYVRVFGDFDKTIATMKQVKADYPWLPLEISFTLSNISIWGIGDFIEDIVEAFGADVGGLYVYVNIALFPVECRPSQLPKDEKRRLLEVLANDARRLIACLRKYDINPASTFAGSVSYNVFSRMRDALAIDHDPDSPTEIAKARNQRVDEFLKLEVIEVQVNEDRSTDPT